MEYIQILTWLPYMSYLTLLFFTPDNGLVYQKSISTLESEDNSHEQEVEIMPCLTRFHSDLGQLTSFVNDFPSVFPSG